MKDFYLPLDTNKVWSVYTSWLVDFLASLPPLLKIKILKSKYWGSMTFDFQNSFYSHTHTEIALRCI